MVEPEEIDILLENHLKIRAKISDTGSGLAECYVKVDDYIIPFEYNKEDGLFEVELKGLDEGLYKIQLVALDRAHSKTTVPLNFLVDSRESFGIDSRIRPGALGKDVELIQKYLVKNGYLSEEKISGVYDTETIGAILTLQKIMGLPVTGIIDTKTRLTLSNKIYIYLDEFALYLISADDKVLKKYSIACGSPYYPTPAGEFIVKEKVYYPAWYPPDSPWARGQKPVPPGPGNPLGTRWVGLNGDSVGIHGTPSDWSIGSASSHGCIRMHIPEVEELFELVDIGIPVHIYDSRPAEHLKYQHEDYPKAKQITKEEDETETN